MSENIHEDQYWIGRCHSEAMEAETRRMGLAEEAEQKLATNLNANLSVDGNQFCWLIGDNLAIGIAGFGDTPALALTDLYRNFHNSRLPPTKEQS